LSKLSDSVLAFLTEEFGNYRIKKEFFVFYRGQKLFFDFYIPELRILVEAQGIQHDKFVEHFHTDASGYRASKRRDRLKRSWIEENDMVYVEVRPSDLPLDIDKFFGLSNWEDYDGS
jgi:hypothetical protein